MHVVFVFFVLYFIIILSKLIQRGKPNQSAHKPCSAMDLRPMKPFSTTIPHHKTFLLAPHKDLKYQTVH